MTKWQRGEEDAGQTRDAEMAAQRRRRQPNEEDELVQFHGAPLKGMKEVLVYLSNTDFHVD